METLEQYLERLGLFGIKLNLDQTRELMKRAGSPDQTLKFLHIAGSNGKGSCGAMLERALRSCGCRTGFYSSPHLLQFGERVRLDGRALNDAELEPFFRKLLPEAEAMKRAGRCPTYFEFTTVLAAMAFAAAKVDFVVWETGMGGRLDSTNVVDPELSIITNISLEHTMYLGTTIPAIAFEKAGIIKPGRPVFTGKMDPAALAVIEKTACERGSEVICAEEVADCRYGRLNGKPCQFFQWRGRRIALPLAGEMQRRNFATIAPALEFLARKYDLPLDRALAGLSRVSWPGRCQLISDRIIVDGGHNPDGVRSLARVIAELWPGEKFCVVFGSFRDKDTRGVLTEAAKFAGEFYFAPLRAVGRPSRSPEELSQLLNEVAPDLPRRCAASVTEAMAMAAASPLRTVAAGSLYLVGEALESTEQTACLEQL